MDECLYSSVQVGQQAGEQADGRKPGAYAIDEEDAGHIGDAAQHRGADAGSAESEAEYLVVIRVFSRLLDPAQLVRPQVTFVHILGLAGVVVSGLAACRSRLSSEHRVGKFRPSNPWQILKHLCLSSCHGFESTHGFGRS
jgi:hypothetical protein